MTFATWGSADDGSHTVGRWLTDRALQDPYATAIDDRGVTISYEALAGRADALAERLRHAGYVPGHRVVEALQPGQQAIMRGAHRGRLQVSDGGHVINPLW